MFCALRLLLRKGSSTPGTWLRPSSCFGTTWLSLVNRFLSFLIKNSVGVPLQGGERWVRSFLRNQFGLETTLFLG